MAAQIRWTGLVRAVCKTAVLAYFFLSVILGLYAALEMPGLRDLGSFISSGVAKNAGLDPYGIYTVLDPPTFVVHFDDVAVWNPNLNPPVSVYLFQLLARIDPEAVDRAWLSASLSGFAAVVAALVCRYPYHRSLLSVAWAFSLGGLWHGLELGQIYVLILVVITAAWLIGEGGQERWYAGLLIGLVGAIKPNFLVWSILLFVGGYRKAAFSALSTTALISCVPLALDGPRIYRQWLEAASYYNGLEVTGNLSLVAAGSRLGSEAVGWFAALALLAVLAAIVGKFRPNFNAVGALAIVGALLVGPLTWPGYTILLLPVLLSRRWSAEVWTAALILAAPFLMLYQFAFNDAYAYDIRTLFYAVPTFIVLGVVVRDVLRSKLRSRLPAVELPSGA